MQQNISDYIHNLGASYASTLPSLAEALVSTLHLFDCNKMYGVGGDFAANLIRALENDINICGSSNEMHAAFSACGQAEIEGLGVCMTTYTVGSLPCTSAAALAKTENLPLIFISGAPGENEISDMALHHTTTSFSSWNVQVDTALSCFKALGIRAERLQGARNLGQPNMAGQQFFNLIAHAYTYNEPVFIEIPRDLVFTKTQAIDLPSEKNLVLKEFASLNGAKLIADTIIEKLQNAKKPLIYLGANSKLNRGLIKMIQDLSHQFNIPYVTSTVAKSNLNESKDLSLGIYNGVFSADAVRSYVDHQVDYVLEIGTSICKMDIDIAYNTGTQKIESFENKTLLKGTAHHNKDIQNIVGHLLKAKLPKFEFTPIKKLASEINEQEPVDFHNITNVLNHLQAKDDKAYIYFPEVGNSLFTSFSLLTKESSLGRSWYANPWYGAMGTSLPYTRAACKVLKERNANDVAIVLTGDGGFNFQLNDLIEFMKDELNVLIIYMRNNIYGLGKNSDAAIYNCNSESFDVIKLIEAYGGEGKRCTSVKEFKDYFAECAHKNKGIKLLEIPSRTDDQYQSRDVKLLNLYIKANNGVEGAKEQWDNIVNDSASHQLKR